MCVCEMVRIRGRILKSEVASTVLGMLDDLHKPIFSHKQSAEETTKVVGMVRSKLMNGGSTARCNLYIRNTFRY
jgi:hypothetical protein